MGNLRPIELSLGTNYAPAYIGSYFTLGFWLLYLDFSFFAFFAPLADVAKGGDGAKSAFCDYSDLCALCVFVVNSLCDEERTRAL